MCFISFSLIFVHTLREGAPCSWQLGAGVGTALLVIFSSWIAMAKTDDYLVPKHARCFFIATAVTAAFPSLGLFCFFLFSEQFPESYLLSFGIAPALFSGFYIFFAAIRIREAYGLPPNYRPEAKTIVSGAIPLILSLPALVVSMVFLGSSIKTLRFESRFDTSLPEFEEETIDAVDRQLQSEELFQLAKAEQRREKYRSAFELFLQAADYGHPEADYELALFFSGEGYLRNLALAHDHFVKAHALGHLEATFRLGKIYRHGELGLEVDSTKAHDYLETAATAGHLEAQTQLGHLYNKGEGVPINPDRAFYWFHKAALQGDLVAQNDVGIFYLQGVGVEANATEGLRWITNAAEEGLTVAEYNLGRALYAGEIVPQDYERAFTYFTRLAEKYIAYGFLMVGQHYLNGHGVEQDLEAAFLAFAEGAGRGDTAAQYQLALCYLRGLGVESNSAAGISYLERAASRSNAEAQLLLGEIYLEGKLMLQDRAAAAAFFRAAVANGLEKAAPALAELESTLTAEEKSYAAERFAGLQGTSVN